MVLDILRFEFQKFLELDFPAILNMQSVQEYIDWQIESAKQLGYVSKIKVALPANIFAEIPEDIPWLN